MDTSEDPSAATMSQAEDSSNCTDVDWEAISYVTVSGSAAAIVWILAGIVFQFYLCRVFKTRPLLVKIEINTLASCLLTFVVFIVVSVHRSREDFLSDAACVGLGGVFYGLLLSSFMWLATEPIVSLACVRHINSIQHKYTHVLPVAFCANYGLPFLCMLILHLASNLSVPLFGNALHNTDAAVAISHQICWMQDRTAMIVAMLCPAILTVLVSVGAGVLAYLLRQRTQSSDLYYPPAHHLLIPPFYFALWLLGGLGNSHLQASSNCDSALALNITFGALAVLFFAAVSLVYIAAARVLSKLVDHEKFAANSLVFIKQSPIDLGMNGPHSPSLSQVSDMTQMTSLSAPNNTAFPALVANGGKKKKSGKGGTFEEVVSTLPTLPDAFTLKPGGQKALSQKAASSSDPALDAAGQSQTGSGSLHGPGGSTENMSLPELVLEKSRSGVDMTRGLQMDDPLKAGSSLPNIGHILKVEKDTLRRGAQGPVPQEVEEVTIDPDQSEPEDHGQVNMSFDELDSESDARGKVSSIPTRSSPVGTMNTLDSDRKAHDPDGASQSHDEPNSQSQTASTGKKQSRNKESKRSVTLPRVNVEGVADGDNSKHQTWPVKPQGAGSESPETMPSRKISSFHKRSSGKRPMQREASWQSSEFESSEMDTLPKTRSLPGHKKHKPDGQEAPTAQPRPKRSTSRKALHDEEALLASPESYLEAHSQAAALSAIDEQAASQPKKRSRAVTIGSASAAKPASKASSEGNLTSIAQDTVLSQRAQSTRNVSGEPRKGKHARSPPHGQDPNYWYQAGYPAASPYSPGYNPYAYPQPQYPPPGPYGQGYGSYYGSPYGGMPPYGYPPGYYGQQPISARQAKMAKKQGRSPTQPAPEDMSGNVYAEVGPASNKKGHHVHFTKQ